MATYRALKGLEVQVQSSDPSNPPKGQVWYNTTTGTLKMMGAGAWSSGGNLTVARGIAASSQAGTQTACISFGGSSPGTAALATNEEYDGTTWTEVGDLNTGRYHLGGAGTSTATVAFGGKTPTTTGVTEEWGGTSWTSNPSPSGDMGSARYSGAAAGTMTAALIASGDASPAGYPAATEEYNGTTWSEETVLPVVRYEIPGAGTTTAALVAGGQSVPGHAQTDTTYEYDGTSWATGGTLPAVKAYNRMLGIQTAAKLCGGKPATTAVLDYDGSSWTAGTSMTSVRQNESAAGTITSGLVIGGGQTVPTYITTVEEFSDPAISTITTST